MRAALAHVRALWPGGWAALTPLPFLLWPLFRLSRGEVRWEFFGFMVLPPLLAFGSVATKKLFVGLYPLGLVGLLYDSMRFVRDVGLSPERVHLCDLRALEAGLFGVVVDGQRTTVHDWLQLHATPALDLVCAVPYATFLFAAIGFTLFLWTRDFRAMQRFAWCFFVLNVAGFATYHFYPAAPPWYFHAHGCTVDMAARASEGPNLARVDHWIGFAYFHGMYGRASDVFGAVPSLHCAYPMVFMVEGWRHFRAPGRVLSIAFFVTMCFAAVYLDHHWVVDVVLGIVYALGAIALLRVVFAQREARPVRMLVARGAP